VELRNLPSEQTDCPIAYFQAVSPARVPRKRSDQPPALTYLHFKWFFLGWGIISMPVFLSKRK
jgi:hypothetical protein